MDTLLEKVYVCFPEGVRGGRTLVLMPVSEHLTHLSKVPYTEMVYFLLKKKFCFRSNKIEK